ncbi:hypothetical protein HBA55_07505 [Pseudomaricurvus alkylphenolicus]|jgi:hypothetical protein|uniref:hypothetical protein n=1 Tax=Pseudomaricurvus alkylphenolicus TaxID=1306991 RepID=UPI00142130F7|nr:hypothetical protein [Pseudomaricurvus alkylphenolicus]NIB39426.1 hypothetical protein [Pseudomaricurvus alkylphenolicus]
MNMVDTGATQRRPLPWFQIFKYTVYGLLMFNTWQFFLEDFGASQHLFNGGITWSTLIEGYAATIDTASWVLLLLLFELETSILSDERLQGRVKWFVGAAKGVCYGFILYSLYGYISKFILMHNFEPSTITDLCSHLPQQLAFMTSLNEFTSLTAANCASLPSSSQFFSLPETQAVADSNSLQLAQNLATVDVVNASNWVLIVIILQIDVLLQLRGQLTGHFMKVTGVIKAILYTVLIGCAVYWGFDGSFLDFWDAFLWIVAFAFIELNIFEWHAETEEEAIKEAG